MNIQKNYLKFIKEYYNNSFDIDFFKNIKSFKSRIDYCNTYLERISSGSGRVVYKLDDTKVLKVAKNTKGIAQNLSEIDFSEDYYIKSMNVLANVYLYDEDGLWLEMEYAKKVNKKIFKDITGYSFDIYTKGISKYAYQANKEGYDEDIDEEIYQEMWEDEYIYDIFQLIGNYGMPSGDLKRLSSYGLVNRDNEDMIVIVDYGLSEEVHKKHYK